MTAFKMPKPHNISVKIRRAQYPEREKSALQDVEFGLSSGDVALITGPTGCGKTTLLRCLNGIIPSAVEADIEGEILWNGRALDFRAMDNGFPRIATVLQNPFHSYIGLRRTETLCGHDTGKWLLESMKRSKSFQDLSAGERMRRSLMRAFNADPDLLLLDEPLSRLDEDGTRTLLDMLERRKSLRRGITVLAEHRWERLGNLVDERIELGETERDANADNCAFDSLSGFFSGRTGDSKAGNGGILVELSGVGMRCNGFPLFSGVNLVLKAGQVTGVSGPNGSGKTTLGGIIAGHRTPTEGTVKTGNRGLKISALFEDPASQMLCGTVWKEVRFAGRNYGIGREAARNLMDIFQLSEVENASPLRLSYGQQERVALAASLAAEPDLVILDEPTQGQDCQGRKRLAALVKSLREEGKGVVVMGHDLDFIREVSDRLLTFERGVLRELD